jgi:predicted permease
VLLIVGQVALSLVLLAGASVLTRSLRRVEATDLGLDRDHLIVADLDVGRTNYAIDRVAAFAHTVRDRVANVPGVAAVTYSENGLFAGTDWSMQIHVPGFSPSRPEDARASNDHVGPDYARSIGARLIAGRDLTTSDESVPFRVATVNQSFERLYFPGRSAVGQFVRVADDIPVQIVGVISDSRGQSVNAPVGRRTRRMYYPFVRNTDPTNLPEHLRLLVRTNGEPAAVMQAVRTAIASVDKTVVLDDITPLASMVRASIREERLVARIATALGVLALVLAAIGLYGVTSYSVARRTSEIGVRVALGAQATDVAGMVLRGVLRPVLVGVVLGTPAAIMAMRLLQAHLTNVMPVDPASIAVATVVLLASAMVAAVAPARRALSIDPVTALRE